MSRISPNTALLIIDVILFLLIVLLFIYAILFGEPKIFYKRKPKN